MGLLGFMVTIWMALVEAPSMGSDWNAPESYRILFIHVPFAWVSFSGFALFFGGSLAWYLKRSDTGWRLAITGAQLGLLYSLGVLISGPIWGAVEWGVPWDFQDVRLNSFAILGGISLFVALSEMNSEDTEQHRDTLSSVGIFGFGLVPLTYMATRWWQERHPGPLIGGGGEDSGVDPSILLIWMIGAVSLQILFVGQAMMTIRLLKTEEKLENLLITMEENT
jgi:heme exporter protein C